MLLLTWLSVRYWVMFKASIPPGDHAVHLGLTIGLGPFVVIGEVDAAHGCGDGSVHLGWSAVICECCRYKTVYPCGGAIVCQRCCYEAVDLSSGAEGCQCCCDSSVSLGCGLVGQQRRGDGSCDCSIGFGNAVSVARQRQCEVIILCADAQRCCDVQIADLIRPNQPVPGNFSGPSLRVDQVGAAAGGQGGQLREDGVNGALQRGLCSCEVAGAREGPGRLQGQDLGVVTVEAGVPQREGGVQDRLRGMRQQCRGDRRCDLGRRLVTSSLQSRDGRVGCGYLGISDGQERVHARGVCVGQQCSSNFLINIGRRGFQVHRSSQVSGAGPVQERRGNFLVHVGPRLLGCEVQGQLIGDGAQGVVRGNAGQSGVVGARDRRVHGRRVAEGLELGVHAGRRALGRHLELQRVQRGLVRLAGQACCEAGAQGREAGLISCYAAFGGGQVSGQSVGSEIGRGGQGCHLGLQRSKGCGIRAYVGGIGCGGFQRRVLSQNSGDLSRRDAL